MNLTDLGNIPFGVSGLSKTIFWKKWNEVIRVFILAHVQTELTEEEEFMT